MLEHGGNLRLASKLYGIPTERWVDLSTGINPHGWPAPPIPPDIWKRLPEADDSLSTAAAQYYGSTLLVPAAGSQPLIQLLPTLRRACRVGILPPSYGEHAYAWQRNGHEVVSLDSHSIDTAIDKLDVLVICNPNNPTGSHFSPEKLLMWREKLAQRDGWLIVDEAFTDALPELSVASHAGLSGLIVLRSLGKFFGLAGARVGFALAWPPLLSQIQEALGPWPINGPARLVATQALQDKHWQLGMRQYLIAESGKLATVLARNGLPPSGSTPLFQWVITPHARQIHTRLAQQGIWTRFFDTPQSIRFGLPGSPHDWHQLETALQKTAEGL